MWKTKLNYSKLDDKLFWLNPPDCVQIIIIKKNIIQVSSAGLSQFETKYHACCYLPFDLLYWSLFILMWEHYFMSLYSMCFWTSRLIWSEVLIHFHLWQTITLQYFGSSLFSLHIPRISIRCQYCIANILWSSKKFCQRRLWKSLGSTWLTAKHWYIWMENQTLSQASRNIPCQII